MNVNPSVKLDLTALYSSLLNMLSVFEGGFDIKDEHCEEIKRYVYRAIDKLSSSDDSFKGDILRNMYNSYFKKEEERAKNKITKKGAGIPPPTTRVEVSSPEKYCDITVGREHANGTAGKIIDLISDERHQWGG